MQNFRFEHRICIASPCDVGECMGCVREKENKYEFCHTKQHLDVTCSLDWVCLGFPEC